MQEREGYALSLDGDGDYLLVPDSPSLALSHLTLELWVLPNSLIQRGDTGLLTKGTPGGGEVYSIDIYEHEYRGFFWKEGILYQVGEGRNLSPITTSWTHIASTYDGDRFALYINGQQVDVRLPTVGDLESNDHEVSIGGRQSWNGIYDWVFNGLIDEVRIWKVARTQEEIQATMYTPLSGNEEGLVGYWNFDDGTANDLSPYHNHGTLYGTPSFVKVDASDWQAATENLQRNFQPIPEPLSGKIARCSFCYKNKNEVRKLIAGRDNVFICDECVALCNDILADE